MKMKSAPWQSSLLLLLGITAHPVAALDSYYCGTSLLEASSNCTLECPSGQDADCTELGQNYSCFALTGCSVEDDGNATSFADDELSAADFNNSTDGNSTEIFFNSTSIDNSSQANLFDTNSTFEPTNETATASPTTSMPTPPPIKTSKPTASPTPNPHLASLQSATDQEITNGVAGSTTSYGILFNIQTSSSSSAVSIVQLDFLTSSTSNLDYELYSTLGSYEGIKGMYGRWILIKKGVVVGNGLGGLTSIELDDDGIPMDGKGSMRAFYLTLSSQDLIYRLSSTSSATGNNNEMMLQLSTDELQLYQGESVHAFPFPESDAPNAYSPQAQFVGAIRYDTAPCKPFEVHGYVDTLPCPVIPTVSPVPSTEAPTTLAPTLSRVPSWAPTFPVTPEPSYMPTTSSPSLQSPPTSSPTSSPVQSIPIQIHLTLTLHNIPNRNMTLTEEDFFIYTLLEFFFLYTTVISVRVDDAAIFLEQSASWKEERRNRLRHLQEGMLASQEYASRAITVTLQAAYFEASYPSGTNINNETTASNSEVEKAIVDLVRENRQDFIISLRGGDELYFMQVDDLILKSVQDVDALLLESQQSAVSKSSVDDVNAVESGSHVGVYAGVGTAVVILCLVIVGSAHHFIKKRHGIEKGFSFHRGTTNSHSGHSKDVESHQPLRSSDTSLPKFISPIDNVSKDSEQQHSDSDSSSQGSRSNAEDEENLSHSSSRLSDCNQDEERENGNSVCKDEPDSSEREDDPVIIPEKMPKKSKKKKSIKAKKETKKKKKKKKSKSRKNKDDMGDSSDDSSSSDSEPSPPRPKKNWKTLQKAVKAGEIADTSVPDAKPKAKNGKDNWAKLSKAVKNEEVKKQKSRKKKDDTGDAIAEIISSNPIKPEQNPSADSSSSSSSDSDSDSSAPRPKKDSKTLQKAVKEGEILQRKDHWKALSQSVNAGSGKSGTARHRSRSLIISSSQDEGDKDRWKTLSKAVKEREHTNSDSNRLRASQTKHSESNPGDVAFRRSTSSHQKKDSMKRSINAGEHRTGETKRTEHRSASLDIDKDDGNARESTKRQPSRKESSRTGADSLRKSSRGVSANAERSSIRRAPSTSESRRRSSSNSDLRQSQSSRNVGSYDSKRDELRRSKTSRNSDELRRSSRNLASSCTDLKRSKTMGNSSEWKKSRRRTVE